FINLTFQSLNFLCKLNGTCWIYAQCTRHFVKFKNCFHDHTYQFLQIDIEFTLLEGRDLHAIKSECYSANVTCYIINNVGCSKNVFSVHHKASYLRDFSCHLSSEVLNLLLCIAHPQQRNFHVFLTTFYY